MVYWGIIMGCIIRQAVYVKEVLLVYAGVTVNSVSPWFQHTALQKAWLLHPWCWLSDHEFPSLYLLGCLLSQSSPLIHVKM